MSEVSKKKLKQVTLPFASPSPAKKRKREDDASQQEETKNRRTCDSTDISSIKSVNSNDSPACELSVNDEISAKTSEGSPVGSPKPETIDDKNMEVDTPVEQYVPDTCDTAKFEVPAIIKRSKDVEKPEKETGSDSESNSNKDCSAQTKKLTPKQLQKRQESEARRLEREKLKQEKEQKRLEEKEAKEKKRLAEIEAKNEEKRQKEEEKRQKEEERRQREEERKMKEEEKRKQREAEKKAREEEKQKKIEEIRLKEEQEKRKKEKTAAQFKNFFVTKSKTNLIKAPTEDCNKSVNNLFMPFEVKEDMKVANITRVILTPERKNYLDEILLENDPINKNSMYLAELKSMDYKPGRSENTWPSNLNDDEDLKDGNSIGNEIRTRYRCKLLQFSENRRPAYWGTWRKRSKFISGKTPFKCDSKFFEYDVDSDEEWVEEPGESLHGSDDEKESDHEYEVDNDFFVPHGYLSDEEVPQDDEGNDQATKLNLLKNEFEAELKEKTYKLKSRSYGCIWLSNSVQKGTNDVENLLLFFRGICNLDLVPFVCKQDVQSTLSGSTQKSPSMKAKHQNEFPEQFVPDFIRLVHGNKNSAKNLAIEFPQYVLSKNEEIHLAPSCVKRKLREIAPWNAAKAYWYVKDEIRREHGLEELSSSENTWNYVTSAYYQPKKISKSTNPVEKTQASVASPLPPAITPTTPKHTSLTKFVKVLTPEEREKQLLAKQEKKKEKIDPIKSVSPKITHFLTQPRGMNPSEQPIKKRAILFSVPKSEKQTTTDNARSSQMNVAVSDGVENSKSADVTFVNPVIKSLFDKSNHSITSSNDGEKETKETVTTEKKSEEDNKKGKKYATLIPVKKMKE